ncbi:MAG: hypothetical protein R3327_03140 [Nitrosopumilaceae archaeon]|nr:hypothetical protein [Nitrosopumilaceae archaeon]
MKYKCQKCRFQWEGNNDTFYQVIEHERIHSEKQKKLESIQKNEKIRISSRRKSQLRGKTINKRITQKKKPSPNRKVTKKRASIR